MENPNSFIYFHAHVSSQDGCRASCPMKTQNTTVVNIILLVPYQSRT